MDERHCPFCGKAVQLLQYGYGLIGLCCNRLVYNNPKTYMPPPQQVLEKDSAACNDD